MLKNKSEAAKTLLMSLPWKGNVRELQNLVEGIVQLYPDLVIAPEHISANMDVPYLASEFDPLQEQRPSASPGRQRKHIPLTDKEIRDALKLCGGNRSEAARYLGIGRRTLYSNMDRLGI